LTQSQTPTDPAFLNLCQALAHLKSGKISSIELVEAYYARIHRFNPQLHAFLFLDEEAALTQARAADARRSAFRRDPATPIPPLLGLPIAIKDVLCVEGMPCTCGSRILETFIPSYDATAVSRLRRAGVVILGKTNTDEFAMGSSTENSAYGTTRNPWDLDRVPGGSSGGSAAAVAARLVPAALGTDTGGSVRQPASFCGVTGLKPTYGRVSRYGLVAFASSLDVVGTFGTSAADAALIYENMAGFDPLDATSMDQPLEAVKLPGEGIQLAPEDKPLHGLRIGVPVDYFVTGIEPNVERNVHQAITQFEELGARVVEIHLPHTEYALPVYYLIAPAEASANLARYDGVRYGPRLEADAMWDVFFNTRGEKFGAEVKRRIMLGTYALSAGYYDAYYGQAQKVRTLIRNDFDAAFEQVDVIAAPVSPTTAFPIGEHSDDPLSMYLEDILTIPANLAGIPSLAFPAGFDHQGLPIGIQLMGRSFGENILFQTAHAYQQVTDWHLQTPATL